MILGQPWQQEYDCCISWKREGITYTCNNINLFEPFVHNKASQHATSSEEKPQQRRNNVYQRRSGGGKATNKQMWVPKRTTYQTCEYQPRVPEQVSTKKRKMCQVWVPKQKNQVAQSNNTNRIPKAPKTAKNKQMWIPKALIQAQGQAKQLWIPKKVIPPTCKILKLQTKQETQQPPTKDTHGVPNHTSKKPHTKQVWRIKELHKSSNSETPNTYVQQHETIKQRAKNIQVKLFGNLSLLTGNLRGSAPTSRAEALGPNCSKTSSCTV